MRISSKIIELVQESSSGKIGGAGTVSSDNMIAHVIYQVRLGSTLEGYWKSYRNRYNYVCRYSLFVCFLM